MYGGVVAPAVRLAAEDPGEIRFPRTPHELLLGLVGVGYLLAVIAVPLTIWVVVHARRRR